MTKQYFIPDDVFSSIIEVEAASGETVEPVQPGSYRALAGVLAAGTHVVGEAPQFTTSATLLGNIQEGETLTLSLGVASGAPAPTLTGVLTLNGVDVTADMVGMEYTIPLASGGQAIVWTVTAANGEAPDATSEVSSLVAAIPEPPQLVEPPDFENINSFKPGDTITAPTPAVFSGVVESTTNAITLGGANVTLPYDVVSGDVGKELLYVTTATNSAGSTQAQVSIPVVNIAPSISAIADQTDLVPAVGTTIVAFSGSNWGDAPTFSVNGANGQVTVQDATADDNAAELVIDRDGAVSLTTVSVTVNSPYGQASASFDLRIQNPNLIAAATPAVGSAISATSGDPTTSAGMTITLAGGEADNVRAISIPFVHDDTKQYIVEGEVEVVSLDGTRGMGLCVAGHSRGSWPIGRDSDGLYIYTGSQTAGTGYTLNYSRTFDGDAAQAAGETNGVAIATTPAYLSLNFWDAATGTGAGTVILRNCAVRERYALEETAPPPTQNATYKTRDPQELPYDQYSVWFVPVAENAIIQPFGSMWTNNSNVLGQNPSGHWAQGSGPTYVPSDTNELRKKKIPGSTQLKTGGGTYTINDNSGRNFYYWPEGYGPEVDEITFDDEPKVPWRDHGQQLTDDANAQGFALYFAGQRMVGTVDRNASGVPIENTADLYGTWRPRTAYDQNKFSNKLYGNTLYGDYDEDYRQDGTDNWHLWGSNKFDVDYYFIADGRNYNASGSFVTRLKANGSIADNVHEGIHAIFTQHISLTRHKSLENWKVPNHPQGWTDASNRRFATALNGAGPNVGKYSMYAGRYKSLQIDLGIQSDLTHPDVRDESRYGSHGGSITSSVVGINVDDVVDLYENDNYDVFQRCMKLGWPPRASWNMNDAGEDANRTPQYNKANYQRVFIWPAGRADEGWQDPLDAGSYSGGNPHLCRGSRVCLPRWIQGKPVNCIYDPAQAAIAREVDTGTEINWYFETKIATAIARALQKFGGVIDDGNSRQTGAATVYDPETDKNYKASQAMIKWRTDHLWRSGVVPCDGWAYGSVPAGDAFSRISHYLATVDGVTRSGTIWGNSANNWHKSAWTASEGGANAFSRDNDWIAGHFCVVTDMTFTNPGGGDTGYTEAVDQGAISFIGGYFTINSTAVPPANFAYLSIRRATDAGGTGSSYIDITEDVFGNALSNAATAPDVTAGKIVFRNLDEGVYQFLYDNGAGTTGQTGFSYWVTWNTAQTDLAVNMT